MKKKILELDAYIHSKLGQKDSDQDSLATNSEVWKILIPLKKNQSVRKKSSSFVTTVTLKLERRRVSKCILEDCTA